MDGYRKQCADKGLPTDDETVVLFAMFPQQVEALIKGTGTPAAAPAAAPTPAPAPTPEPAPAAGPQPDGKRMVLTINGERHEVFVEKLD
jgi:hypothetical protein